MKAETTIVYKGVTCRILTEPKYWDNPIIGIENVNGKVPPFHQKMISNTDFTDIMKLNPPTKPEPKYDPNKESRLMYMNRAETPWTTLKEVMKKRQHLLKKNEYQESKFIIEQR